MSDVIDHGAEDDDGARGPGLLSEEVRQLAAEARRVRREGRSRRNRLIFEMFVARLHLREWAR